MCIWILVYGVKLRGSHLPATIKSINVLSSRDFPYQFASLLQIFLGTNNSLKKDCRPTRPTFLPHPMSHLHIRMCNAFWLAELFFRQRWDEDERDLSFLTPSSLIPFYFALHVFLPSNSYWKLRVHPLITTYTKFFVAQLVLMNVKL